MTTNQTAATTPRCDRHPEREGIYAFASHYLYVHRPQDAVRADQVFGPFCAECRSEFIWWATTPASDVPPCPTCGDVACDDHQP